MPVDVNDADEEQKLQRETVRSGISRMFSELGLLSGDIHIKLLEAEGEYQDAFDEIEKLSGGNMTSSDVKRLAELVPLRDSAKLRLRALHYRSKHRVYHHSGNTTLPSAELP